MKPSVRDGRAELSRVRLRLTKTTSRLGRHVEALRNQGLTPGEFGIHARDSAGAASIDPLLARRYPNPQPTNDYPAQGKLQTPPLSFADCADWEPAESLNIAIIVGRDELDSGRIRNHFGRQRRQRHHAMVYRWQGEFTLDVLGFDAIDPEAERSQGRVDMVLLSDWILGQQPGRTPVRDLERIALQTRLRFRSSYIVGLMADPAGSDLDAHAFYSVERKTRTKGIAVFDQILAGQVDQDRITRLLVSYGRSHRYTSERSVWITPHGADSPIPITKADMSSNAS